MATHNCVSNWIIRLHEQGLNAARDKAKLKPFDLCVFHHTQNNSYLSVEGHSNRVILKELKSMNVSHLPLEAIWELQPLE